MASSPSSSHSCLVASSPTPCHSGSIIPIPFPCHRLCASPPTPWSPTSSIPAVSQPSIKVNSAELTPKPFPHSSHLKGFWPRWELSAKCFPHSGQPKGPRRRKVLVHSPQENGRSPEWKRLCWWSTRLEWWGFSPVWVRRWLASVELPEKRFPHSWHWYGFSPV
uniref:Uncharacterized protein n=1 Tax=Naja naja TaxID=35670 RepID=A0A8C7E2X6_NAJNA